MLKSIVRSQMEAIASSEDVFNATNKWQKLNATFLEDAFQNSTSLRQSMPLTCTVIITISYLVGIVGNLAAVITLCRGDKKIKNRKHALMLKSLAVNDLVALVGMMMLMTVQNFLPPVVLTQWFCALRVVWRIFGLGSVCIAIVMALERWLALTQPFLYQKHVTYYVVRKALIVLWCWAAILTCLPFLGFGIYYDREASHYRCLRYRDATDTIGVAYAYVYLSFGTLLCICLVWCNLAVIRVLCRSSSKSADQRLLVRRISRTSNKSKPLAATNLNDPIIYNAATADEIAFSKLMATLSVCFIICWMPQMVSIMLAQLNPPEARPRLHKIVFLTADILMLLNYTLDPYIYVLLRGNNKPFPSCIKSIFRSRLFGKKYTHQDSLKLASHQDGMTALTVLDITPPATTANSPPWPKKPPVPVDPLQLLSVLPQSSNLDMTSNDMIPLHDTNAKYITNGDQMNNDLKFALNNLSRKNNPELV